MAYSTASCVLSSVCHGSHRQLCNFVTKRQSCFLANHTKQKASNALTLHSTIAIQQHQLYSSGGSRSPITAYHKQGLNGFVYSLSVEERDELLQMLSKASQTTDEVQTPTRSQLQYVALFSGVPFIGFGILDNTIMLTAGEYIDITFGAWLGITTMAAAALGNMISDVLGITTAGFVEQTALKFGLKAPPITLEQMSLRRTRIMANLGRCIGVCIGCFIGMWPLLVLSKDREEENSDKQTDTTNT